MNGTGFALRFSPTLGSPMRDCTRKNPTAQRWKQLRLFVTYNAYAAFTVLSACAGGPSRELQLASIAGANATAGTGASTVGATAAAPGTRATAGTAAGASGQGSLSGQAGSSAAGGSLPVQGSSASGSGSSAGGAAAGAAGQSPAASGAAGVAIAGGGTGGPTAGGPTAGATGTTTPTLPQVTSTAGPGPFATMQDLRGGPARSSGIFRPVELGRDGVKHPIFVWGCGGGSTPTTYADLMTQIASHGFVVIAETSQINDAGAPLKAAIDWLVSEASRTDSVFYAKLDTSKIGLGGHSIGSANAFIVGTDPRLTTTIHVAGGSLDMPGDINAATTGSGGKRLIHPVAFVCSEMDQFGNVEKTTLDFQNTSAPAWMTVMTGVDHVAAARQGLPAIIAWLRWHLAGESERRSAFLDPMGEWSSGKYVSKIKNW